MKVHVGEFLFRRGDKLIVRRTEGDDIEVDVLITMERVVQRQMKRGTIYYFRNGPRWLVSIRGPVKRAPAPAGASPGRPASRRTAAGGSRS